MTNLLKLGIIGISEGNGHPYSWSSIFNGFDAIEIKKSKFPIIEEYLSLQKYPDDFINSATVTHIWTQDYAESKKIANASKIPNICLDYLDMITKIDALLLARDDAQSHFNFAEPFIKVGMPIYIDKPLALSINEANKLYDLEEGQPQIFTCSALRFAKEFKISSNTIRRIGEVEFIKAFIPNKWATYAVHVIEPIISQLSKFRKPTHINFFKKEKKIKFCYSNKNLSFEIFFELFDRKEIKIIIFGNKGEHTMIFKDSFSAFKKALEMFIEFIITRKNCISKNDTLDVVRMIEMGNKNV